jgi:hypothetical protein
MTDIKREIAKILESDYGIEPEITEALFERRILFEPAIRNALIREEYLKKIRPKEKMRVRENIAEKYCISAKMVERLTY